MMKTLAVFGTVPSKINKDILYIADDAFGLVKPPGFLIPQTADMYFQLTQTFEEW